MKSATQTTLLMMVLAAISVGVAMYYYPWPEFAIADDEVGKPLFESYQAKDIRGIDIIRFDSENQNLDRIKLTRRGEKWVIPARQNYIANQSLRIGTVVNALNDKTVYDVISENQEDHIKFGVLDPSESLGDRNIASLGTKLTLTDRNNKTVADVIVGMPVKNDPQKRHVRIPGKPRVYLIDFDANLLSTQFALWLSPNILEIQPEQGRQIREIQVESYQILQEQNAAKKKYSYRASLVPGSGRLNIKSLEIPQGDSSWYSLKTTPDQIAKLSNVVRPIALFFVDDVRRKNESLALALSENVNENSAKEFKIMNSLGFFFNKNESKFGPKFDSVNGQARVKTSDGVTTTILVGQVAGANSVDKNKLNYYVILNSDVDEALRSKPVRPVGTNENDDSPENRAYLKKVKDWEDRLEKASRAADELNALHSDWYYLVSEAVIKTLIPEVPLPDAPQKTTKPTKTSDTENTGEPENANGENERKSAEKKPQSEPAKDRSTEAGGGK
ncbi:MAG: DUF4340 domain-containing protein [Planctomycetota bacterium]